MLRRLIGLTLLTLMAFPAAAPAQTSFRLKGSVRDGDGKPVPGLRIHAEALNGFRGEQFVGQKEFEASTGPKGEWVIVGLTPGIWTFEATGPEIIPQVVVLPISFTTRKPQSAQGGSFSWALPLQIRRSTHAGLMTAASVATAKQMDDALTAIGTIAGETDPDVLCANGELALLVRQGTLAKAIFDRVLKAQPRHACATLGMASSALMLNDYNGAARSLWTAMEVAPREQRPALGAALKDLQNIASLK